MFAGHSMVRTMKLVGSGGAGRVSVGDYGAAPGESEFLQRSLPVSAAYAIRGCRRDSRLVQR
jgi:hypothetical protein